VLLPYTQRSAANLFREGIAHDRVFVTGNPIREVLEAYAPQIDASQVLEKLAVAAGQYLLVTLHRAENVDAPERVEGFLEAFDRLHEELRVPVVWPVHPRTRHRLEELDRSVSGAKGLRLLEPLGLFDFVRLERNALCVLTDSGTVQEECCLFRVPCVTLRNVTERPETLEVGSNVLSGAAPGRIVECVRMALARPPDWTPYPELLATNVSSTIGKLLLGYR